MSGLVQFLSVPPGWITLAGLVVLLFFGLRGGTSLMRSGFGARQIMAIVVTLIVLAAALYVILNGGYNADTQKWAFGAVGLIVGYWLPAKA